MKLYSRDYTILTEEESEAWEAIQAQEAVDHLGRHGIRKPLFRKYPKAARHFSSLFPNNYLDVIELQHKEVLAPIAADFRKLIESSGTIERDILAFIKTRHAHFVVGGLLKAYYPFGHHDAFLFPEFQLGNSLTADYLLVGLSSDGWHLLLVEFEGLYGKITLKDGALGEVFRKGLSQTSAWNSWLQAHYPALEETFNKHLKAGEVIPAELRILDMSRIHYVVVAGRRSDFGELTYRIRRKKQKESAELLLHYDNLADGAENVIGEATY